MFLTDNIFIPISLPFRKDRKAYCALKRILGFYPRHLHYYKQALMHKSMHTRTPDGQRVNNERLEFLGDAILGAVVGDIVFRYFQGKREGFLTNTRSKVVKRETLNRVAVEIGLDKLIQSSISRSAHNSNLCGNAFEAFIGAIYLDQGYERCKRFIDERILHRLIDLDQVANEEMNYKSKLIEWCQKRHLSFSFQLVSLHRDREEAYSPVFESQVLLEGIVCGKGVGYSKKESHQHAAKAAYKNVKRDKELVEQVLIAKELRENPIVEETEDQNDHSIEFQGATMAEQQKVEEIEIQVNLSPTKPVEDVKDNVEAGVMSSTENF